MKKLIEQLNKLKAYGLYALKCDFEAEGASEEELAFCKQLASEAELLCFLKIGGAEAVYDLKIAKKTGVDAVVAPMIESPFAVTKYLNAVERVFEKERPLVMINLESKEGEKNAESIVNAANGLLDGITIGRVDYCASYGVPHEKINDTEILPQILNFAKNLSKLSQNVTVGGGVDYKMAAAIMPFNSICESYETRKLVFYFGKENEEEIYEALKETLKFETEYLKYKKEHLTSDDYDEARLEKIEKELDKFGE